MIPSYWSKWLQIVRAWKLLKMLYTLKVIIRKFPLILVTGKFHLFWSWENGTEQSGYQRFDFSLVFVGCICYIGYKLNNLWKLLHLYYIITKDKTVILSRSKKEIDFRYTTLILTSIIIHPVAFPVECCPENDV